MQGAHAVFRLGKPSFKRENLSKVKTWNKSSVIPRTPFCPQISAGND